MKVFSKAGLSKFLVIVGMVAGTAIAQAQTSTWKIDPAHSEADFTVKHMGISNVHGRFGGVTGTVNLDEKDPGKSSVNATIDVTTVDTGNSKRDDHLKSPDFFDAAKYPTMNFVSKKLTDDGGKKQLIGDLTMHGVTKSVTLDLDGPSKEQVDPQGKTRIAFSATTSIHRQDFGLIWSGSLKSGDSVVGDDIKVELDVEIVKQ
ncbi:Protein yceI precursor [Acidisarcina polymorpha]|uniref:Protein yceI n=1 Tax=Acidisarcina polymorpha TaxID=2211140 RepID=A0A2Z5FTS3_9BACT|nr:YceI family protein [Acidisarcina polymorpha]AXC09835.1 Protein yceI precursor [Acidisarcina polymorpha]